LATKKLKRDLRREALLRMEEAARSVEDFYVVMDEWNLLDENRERKERKYEVQRPEDVLIINYTDDNETDGLLTDNALNNKYSDGMIFPTPYSHLTWREARHGDFLSMIFDSAEEMWQIIEDWDIALPVKSLTYKQANILFLIAVRQCTPQHIACYYDKTDRAVRKLLAATLESIRSKIAPRIRAQIESGYPQMTLEKRIFIEWYDKSKGEQK